MAKHLAHPETWALAGWLGIVLLVSVGLAFFVSSGSVVIGAGTLLAIILFLRRPEWGVYLLAFLACAGGLMVDFSREPSLARLPFIGSINAPLVDFLAIILVLLAVVLLVVRPAAVAWRNVKDHFWFFVLWYAVVVAAWWWGEAVFFGVALKAVFRPYIFTAVLAAPALLFIRHEKMWERTLLAYELAAVSGAVFGLISLFVLPVVGFVRAQPLTFFGLTPFGNNHNVLAESLTAIIPFAFWFAATRPEKFMRRWAYAAAIFITLISLLTFSRAAWLVVALQFIVWFFWQRHQKKFAHEPFLLRNKISFGVLATALGMLLVFFLWVSNTIIAERSNATRVDLTGIAWTYWQRAPWLGQGPGTFVSLVDETFTFKQDYGEALDAHGFVQKVAAETGLFGLGALGLLLGALFYKLWRRHDEERVFIMLLVLLSAWSFQLFNTGYFAGKVWVLMGAALALLAL